MDLHFYKYQGTGNDFVLIDNRTSNFKNDTKIIKKLCDRRFGVGADGLILLENSSLDLSDFKMVYFNADGNESTMCGNGGRCIVAFAKKLGVIESETTFEAIDGLHSATIKDGFVNLKMVDVPTVNLSKEASFLDTGSPHHVAFVDDVYDFDVFTQGRRIRNLPNYEAIKGTNVNFIQIKEGVVHVRTYERGVEDETLSCGTGVTAAAITAKMSNKIEDLPVKVITKGGTLEVDFEVEGPNAVKNIWLKGPATFVFEGDYDDKT
ncbi:diaminopimelate epimerase [Psychroflexus montanilacus]|uniref:diaminopimelate epimerase n=1 Tax=Psychroflexus montanilacus TaxID=2873598 RepID=UPI001CC902E1|nr:diaminopimelate epimerase [Psychroflexus montanilacus]MBZ9651044.1 diaminopimelate epimerase [Psychroflexus montanilacus]